jgi:hypothetical protein
VVTADKPFVVASGGRSVGPIEAAVRAVPPVPADTKRFSVLVALARLLDGRPDPSVREVAGVAKRHRMECVLVLDRLAHEGVIQLTRGAPGDRTTYRIPAAEAASSKEEKVKTPTTTRGFEAAFAEAFRRGAVVEKSRSAWAARHAADPKATEAAMKDLAGVPFTAERNAGRHADLDGREDTGDPAEFDAALAALRQTSNH